MIQIILQKISDEIKNRIRTRRSILISLGKIKLILNIALIVAFPRESWELLGRLATRHDWIITRLIYWMAVWLWTVHILYPLLVKRLNKDKVINLFYWVELDRIIDHIIEHGTFKRDDIVRKFWVNRNTAQDMIDKLDNVGVFVKGMNNIRQLDINLKREDIESLILSPLGNNNQEKIIEDDEEELEDNAVQALWPNSDNHSASQYWFTRERLAN